MLKIDRDENRGATFFAAVSADGSIVHLGKCEPSQQMDSGQDILYTANDAGKLIKDLRNEGLEFDTFPIQSEEDEGDD